MIKSINRYLVKYSMINHNDISYEMRYNQTPQADGFFVCGMMGRFIND